MSSIHAVLAVGMLLFTAAGAAFSGLTGLVRTDTGSGIDAMPTTFRRPEPGRGLKVRPESWGTGWLMLMAVGMADLVIGDPMLPAIAWGFLLILAAPASMAVERLIGAGRMECGMALHRALCLIAMGTCTVYLHTGHAVPLTSGHHAGPEVDMKPLVLAMGGLFAAYSLWSGFRMARHGSCDRAHHARAGEVASGALALLCMMGMAIA